jgi:hypothetical protein
MQRDEEDFLFAQEMAQSRRRFEDAMRLREMAQRALLYRDLEAARARCIVLITASAQLRDACRRAREEAAQLRQGVRFERTVAWELVRRNP